MTATRFFTLAISLAFCAACAHQGVKPSAPLPIEFSAPDVSPDLTIDVPIGLIERRLRSSKCGNEGSSMAKLGMGSGISSRGPAGNSLFMDSGRTADGASWFLIRDRMNPEWTYCGIALFGDDQATRISLSNVRRNDIEEVRTAIQSGDFFCKCRQLSGRR